MICVRDSAVNIYITRYCICWMKLLTQSVLPLLCRSHWNYIWSFNRFTVIEKTFAFFYICFHHSTNVESFFLMCCLSKKSNLILSFVKLFLLTVIPPVPKSEALCFVSFPVIWVSCLNFLKITLKTMTFTYDWVRHSITLDITIHSSLPSI